ncbi:MAG: glutamate--tRNA ligase family protein [Candidatus Saccharimonas sp.]
MNVRTRFAPSPTGFLHVGGIRTALFAYLVARQAGGKFVLRLEDTDRKRLIEGSREHLIASLKTIGIEYDEGPDIGGPFAPYVQSERLESYAQWARVLINKGLAYADPYTAEEVQHFREQAQANKKAFLYRDFRPENPPEWDGSQPLRFRSTPKSYTYHDEVMGTITTSPEVIDDIILIKSDGYPTYNFAHIIDDTEMEITHVIRGQEFISSMPNYLALYEALGFEVTLAGDVAQHDSAAVALEGEAPLAGDDERGSTHISLPVAKNIGADSSAGPASSDLRATSGSDDGSGKKRALPAFAHMPHIMNEQGNKKLGKRDGAKDVLDYIRDGYLPETMMSFIATLGWNDGTEQEVFTRNELIEKFGLDRIQRSGARFDEKRLLWMNGHFIRELSLDELYNRCEFFWSDTAKKAPEDYKKRVLALAHDRLKTLKDLPGLTSYFFAEPTRDDSLITTNKQLKKLSSDEVSHLLDLVKSEFETLDDWTPEAIQTTLNNLLETTGQKPGTLFSLVRIVTTWAPFSPQLNDTLALLGKQKTLLRLSKAF